MKKWIRKWLGIDHLVKERVVLTEEEVIKIVKEELFKESATHFYDSISEVTSKYLKETKFIGKVIERVNQLQLNK